MNFSQMHERLRTEMLRRIQRGELTVTLLSKQIGFGRSHVSNFLHSRGRLSSDALDRILIAQRMKAEDLVEFTPRVPSRTSRDVAVPLVSHTTALFEPDIRSSAVQMWLSLPQQKLGSLRSRAVPSRHSWRRFVAISIDAAAAKSLEPFVHVGAIAVIDRHYNSLAPSHPPQPNIYAVCDCVRVALRLVERVVTHLIIRPLSIEFAANLIEVAPNANPGEYIAGRVVLILNPFGL